MSVDVSRCSACGVKKGGTEREERGEKGRGEQKRKQEEEAGLSEAAEKDAPVCLCKTLLTSSKKTRTETANVQNTLQHAFFLEDKMFKCEQCQSNI